MNHREHQMIQSVLRHHADGIAAYVSQFYHCAVRPELLAQLRSTFLCRARGAVEHLDVPDDYFAIWVGQDRVDPSRVVANFYRHLSCYPMCEAEFEQVFGRPPQRDDLHRVNCDQAGELGHLQCGWCGRHQTARFACGCVDD